MEKVTMFFKSGLDQVRSLLSPAAAPPGKIKFATFGGVFTPTILTILGAIMYLREGWVVGNAGLGGALLIIVMANVITICTGLSISSVATNIRVRAGGAFSIISQSLGLEVGGSISVPFYFAQAISVAFYIFAFTEGWMRIFPTHSEIIVVFTSFAIAFAIVFISANVAVRAQFLILTVLVLSLFSVLMGSFAIGGQPGLTAEPTWMGDFADGDFWYTFAIFFPAVTGILGGVNMSGELQDPRKSIPVGTMAAVCLSFLVYLALAYWFARVATPDELVTNPTVVVDKAFWGPAVLAGILAATFSSALTSLLGAPRILQAIAEHGIIPRGKVWAKTSASGEPRPAMYLTGAIALGGLFFGLTAGENGLNTIAPLMSMFFMITYAMLNGVVLLEQYMGLISFRPLFWIPLAVPLIGLIGCLFAMFLIDPIFSLVSLVVTVILYAYLTRRRLRAPWSDVRSGLFVSLAEWAAKRVSSMPTSQERAWKPSLLVPVQDTDALMGSYRFLKALTYPRGSVRVLALHPVGDKGRIKNIGEAVDGLNRDGIFARVAVIEVEEFARGLRIGMEILRSVFFRPNGLFMPVSPDTDQQVLQAILDRAAASDIGAVLFAKHPITSLGREQIINVWIREQSPAWEIGLHLTNLDLALLLAYQISRNWKGRINLITVVADQAELPKGEKFLNELINLGRMPHGTKAIVEGSSLESYLPKAPKADLNIFGLQEKVDLAFIQRMVNATNASCLFVRDSGQESALA